MLGDERGWVAKLTTPFNGIILYLPYHTNAARVRRCLSTRKTNFPTNPVFLFFFFSLCKYEFLTVFVIISLRQLLKTSGTMSHKCTYNMYNMSEYNSCSLLHDDVIYTFHGFHKSTRHYTGILSGYRFKLYSALQYCVYSRLDTTIYFSYYFCVLPRGG